MEANIALPAALIGDPVRAAMLSALCDGRAQPASALAYAARVTPQCASNHLAKLLDGGLLTVETEGRHRYYQLATPCVAAAIEALAGVAPPIRSLDVPVTRKAHSLRFGRFCYDHLAGCLGVAITVQLEARRYLIAADGAAKRYSLTSAGRRWFEDLGVDVGALRPTAAGLARRCLDWTERRHHLAGPLGAALSSRFVELGWICREDASRAVGLTPRGIAELRRRLEIEARDLLDARLEVTPTVLRGTATDRLKQDISAPGETAGT